MESSVQLHRVEYGQIGLCSNNCLQAMYASASGNLLIVVGEQSGSVNGFLVRANEMNKASSVFRTLAVGQSPVSCVQIIPADTHSEASSLKVMAAFENAFVRGFSRRGKEFFGIELSYLTEPIKHFWLKWPTQLYVAGLYTYNQFLFGSTDLDPSASNANESSRRSSGASNRIQNGIRFVSPAQITGFVVINQKMRQKVVSVLACEDRLLRILLNSTCEHELETCGIVSCLIQIKSDQPDRAYLCYGTLDGRISLACIDFGTSKMQTSHCWEIHLLRSRSPVQCVTVSEQLDYHQNVNVPMSSASASDSDEQNPQQQASVNSNDLCVGRADGSIELFTFQMKTSSAEDGKQFELVDISTRPHLSAQFKVNESIAGIQLSFKGQTIIAVTFTGSLFALLRSEAAEVDLSERIEELEVECQTLDAKLIRERTRYQEMSSASSKSAASNSILDKQANRFELRALPGFQMNDSFVLQNDASYLLTLECEAAIDCVFVQSDIPLDLMDCERNSAVVSFNDTSYEANPNEAESTLAKLGNGEILATFRCQADTKQLQIRICTIEGHFGLIQIYVISRLTPKVCLVRQFHVKALSLHKRNYFDSRVRSKLMSKMDNQMSKLNHIKEESGENDVDAGEAAGALDKHMNQMILIGSFSLIEAHAWLYNALPEIPEKLTSSSGVVYTFECTLTSSLLKIQLVKGRLNIQSNSVSTISILKEYCTREATRKGIAIELRMHLSQASVNMCLSGVFRRLIPLIKQKQAAKIKEAIAELSVGEPEATQKMIKELNLFNNMDQFDLTGNTNDLEMVPSENCQSSELDRLYGLIADLYIDYQKLNGTISRTFIQNFKSKIGEMIILIEKSITQNEEFDLFAHKLNSFWGFDYKSV